MEQTVGRDISKFFYGGYSLDGNLNMLPGQQSSVHPHSNMARKVAFQNIVAVIGKPDVQEGIFSLDDKKTNKVNKTTSSFTFNSVTSESHDDLKMYHDDIKMLGKHYTFVPVDDFNAPVREAEGMVLKRHYTIANCMRLDFYTSLVNALTQQSAFDAKLLNSESCNSVNVTVKDYSLQQGISRYFSRSSQCNYSIKGPMGRGLELTSKSKGTHVAFAAGTGILVFVDLVTRLALGQLGLIS